MLPEFFKIAEQIKNLRSAWREAKQQFFKNNVEPIYQEFSKIHNEYLKAFQKYQKILSEPSESLDNKHPLYKYINEDIVTASAKRSEVIGLIEHIDEPGFASFLNGIYHYLNDSYYYFDDSFCSIDYDMTHDNAPRRSLIAILERLSYINRTHLNTLLEQYSNGYISLPSFIRVTISTDNPFTVDANSSEEQKVETIKKIALWQFSNKILQELELRHSAVSSDYGLLKKQFLA